MEEGPQQQGHDLENGTKALSIHPLLMKRYYVCIKCQHREESMEKLMRHMKGECKKICPDCNKLRYIKEFEDQKIYKCSGSCRSDHQLNMEETKEME